jgi:hypothetical protein
MENPLLFCINAQQSGITTSQIEQEKICPVDDNISCVSSFLMSNNSHIVSFASDGNYACIYKAYDPSSDKYLILEAKNALSFNTALSDICYIAQSPVCLAYDPTTGNINILIINPDLSFTLSYTLNAGTGITTLKAFSYRGAQFFIAYNMTMGNVTKYQIVTNADSTITANQVWNAKWAISWTRFSFFLMGAENFFIKTNTTYNKVNIDHFMDDPNEGSHPVLNMDAPPQMVGLNNVATFCDSKGFPYFATYRSNGEMTFNSIYGNCLGWDTENQLVTETGKNLMLIFTVNSDTYLFLY